MSHQREISAFAARRQRRIARRRRQILQAAAQVFAEKGYAATTTKEIAGEADMAEGTLYNYFAGKREILLAIVQETDAPMEAAFCDVGEVEDREAMITLVERAFDISEQNLPFMRAIMMEAWLDDSILQEFLVQRLQRVYVALCDFIEQRVETGSFRPIAPSLGARLAMGMVASVLLPVLRGVTAPPTPQERRYLAETLVELLLDGIRVRESQPA